MSLDNRDLTDLNVGWLRHQIAYVGQEPRLFSGTIAENIANGAYDPSSVTRDDVVRAAEMANAHDFV